jgi:hypothetical protein
VTAPKLHLAASSVDRKRRNHLCQSRRTCFSPSIYLLMALVDDPVRSFKAKMASLISARVVMMLILYRFVGKRIFLFFVPCVLCEIKKLCLQLFPFFGLRVAIGKGTPFCVEHLLQATTIDGSSQGERLACIVKYNVTTTFCFGVLTNQNAACVFPVLIVKVRYCTIYHPVPTGTTGSTTTIKTIGPTQHGRWEYPQSRKRMFELALNDDSLFAVPSSHAAEIGRRKSNN